MPPFRLKNEIVTSGRSSTLLWWLPRSQGARLEAVRIPDVCRLCFSKQCEHRFLVVKQRVGCHFIPRRAGRQARI